MWCTLHVSEECVLYNVHVIMIAIKTDAKKDETFEEMIIISNVTHTKYLNSNQNVTYYYNTRMWLDSEYLESEVWNSMYRTCTSAYCCRSVCVFKLHCCEIYYYLFKLIT